MVDKTESGRPWIKVNGPKRQEVDGPKNWLGVQIGMKVNGPKRQNVDSHQKCVDSSIEMKGISTDWRSKLEFNPKLGLGSGTNELDELARQIR